MPVEVTVSCKCGMVHRNVPKALWGQKTRCQVCGRTVRVPAPETPRETLDDVFAEFARSLAEPAAEETSPRKKIERYRLGRLAVRTGLASRDEIDLAMQVQTRCRDSGILKQLGALLVEQGTLEEADVRRLLEFQRRKIASIRVKNAGAAPPLSLLDSRIARVVVECGFAGQGVVDECAHVLALTLEMGFRWGMADVLAERGAIDRELAARIRRDEEALLQRGLARVEPRRPTASRARPGF